MAELLPGRAAAPASGEQSPLLDSGKSQRGHWLLRLAGPGLLVCLADTDAGCLIVAAQSGATWGYSLLWLQIALVPILFMAQELTVRLGVYTHQGHTACIREHFGPRWAWFATSLLVFECIAAMMSEMSGVAAVAEIWGMSRAPATLLAAAVIVTTVLSCSYRQIERVGICLGLFELVFVVTMVVYHPRLSEVFEGSVHFSGDPDFVKLIAANIGAVIMPWMIYFQQSAVVARRLVTQEDLKAERADTVLGSILTQLIMIGTLVTLAATKAVEKGAGLDGVGDIAHALSPFCGQTLGKVAVSLGFLGGSLSASFVVSLAAAWAVCEAMGLDAAASLDRPPAAAPHFYGAFVLVIGLSTVILLGGVNVVTLNVLVELLDGLLLPFAIGFLFFLATGPALPPEVRVQGLHKGVLATVFTLCSMLSVGTAVYGIVAGA